MGIRSEIVDRSYIFEYEVGIWTFGTVQVLKDKEMDTLKSCRVVTKSLLENPGDALARLRRLQRLQHAHLCSIVDVLEDKTHIFIISDKTAGNDVAEWLERTLDEGNWIQEQTCAAYLREALLATVHAHAFRVFHRELRPGTLQLTTKLPDATVKVSDFGLAVILDPKGEILRKQGGPYVAPEIREGSDGPIVSSAADMWSIGAIAHALLVGHPPAAESSWSRRSAEDDAAWAERSGASRDFVRRLLAPAGERPTAARALRHPWLQGALTMGVHPGVGADTASYTSKVLCYQLAVLLMPEVMEFKTFHNLRAAFSEADEDRDGIVLGRKVQELLVEQGAKPEAAATGVDVADATLSGTLDLCGAAVAALVAQECGDVAGSAGNAAPRLLKRFLSVYGDAQNQVVSVRQLRSRLCTATGREVEVKAGVNFDEILAPFLPEGAVVSGTTLAAELSQSDGRGTPLWEEPIDSGDEDEDRDGSCGLAFGFDRMDDFFAQLLQSCSRGGRCARGPRTGKGMRMLGATPS